MKKHTIQKLIYNLKFVIGLVILSSCTDELDEKVWSDVAVKDFYSNQTEFNNALNGLYHSLRGTPYGNTGYLHDGDETTDILSVLNRRGVSSGGYDYWDWNASGGDAGWWSNSYTSISNANRILDALEKVELSEDFENRMAGEALFFRAFYYYSLVKVFYNVPIIDKPIDAITDENLYKGRNTIEECWEFIENDLMASVTKLSPFDMSMHQQGLVTAASAQALLTRVYAWQQKWQAAIASADKVLSMPGIALEPDFAQIWNPDREYTGEHLFSISNAGTRNSFGWGEMAWRTTAKGYADDNLGIIRFSIDEDESYTGYEVPPSFYESYPPHYRKTYSVRDWMPYYINQAGERIDDTVNFPEGIAPTLVKYAVHLMPDNKTYRADVNVILIRTAEMYLIKAEALNEMNGATQEACDALNVVRQRARAVGTAMEEPANVYPDIMPGMGKEDFRDIVIEEFAREFVGEGLFREVLIRHDRFHTRAWAETQPDGSPLVPGQNQQMHKIFFNIPLDIRERNSNLNSLDGYESN